MSDSKSTISALEFLDKEQNLQKLARNVLRGKFDKCTRRLGITMQKMYSCTDCSNRACCYACSIACHSDHNIIELGTRRRILCDCGAGFLNCKLESEPNSEWKKENSDTNVYNHNSEGLYCWCIFLLADFLGAKRNMMLKIATLCINAFCVRIGSMKLVLEM